MHWKKSDISQIHELAENKTTSTLEGLSRRLGVDSVSLREKLHEIKEKSRISKLALH